MIVFERVRASRGSRTVLDDVSFRVDAGETLVLVGRSGAGKSTVLKLINRMLEPESGTVSVDGRDTRGWDSTTLRRRARAARRSPLRRRAPRTPGSTAARLPPAQYTPRHARWRGGLRVK